MIRALALVLAVGCGGTPKPVEATPPAPAPTAATTQATNPPKIEVTMAKRTGPGASIPVAAGATLATGELVELHVTVDRSGYVYVAQFFADGTFDLIYPTTNVIDRIEVNTRIRVPSRPGAWLKISGAPGEEHVHVMFTASPLASVSPALATAFGLATDQRAPAQPVAAATRTPPAPTAKKKAYTRAGAKTKPLLVTYDPGSKALTEVLVDDAPVNLSTTGGVTVHTFVFNHAP